MGTLFMVNPPRRKSRKRRTAAQKRATAKMIAANKRKRSAGKKKRRAPARARNKVRRIRKLNRKVAPVARKRRRRTTARRAAPRRRRRSSTKRRSPVTSLRRHSVYLTNPRRKRRRVRRSRYRRNPSIVGQIKQGVFDAGATLAGGAAARVVSGMLPLPKDGLAGTASSLAVALAVGMVARKVVSHDTARFLTAGAMQVPVKNLITTFLPGAGAYLGDYDNIGTYAVGAGGVGNYLSPGMYGQPIGAEDNMGVYEN